MVGVAASLSISEKDFQFKFRYKSCFHSLCVPIVMKYSGGLSSCDNCRTAELRIANDSLAEPTNTLH